MRDGFIRKITRQQLANGAPKRWAEQYRHYDDHEKLTKTSKLLALSSPVNPDDVDSIIGNDSWTRPTNCDGCGKISLEEVTEIGPEPDYDCQPIYLCPDCIAEIGKHV